jgi:hypothetical protein
MAGKSKRNAEQAEKKQLIWLSVPVTDDMVAKAQSAATDHADLFGTLGALLLLGFGVSVKPSNDGAGVMATLLKDADDDIRQPLGLSAFAPDAGSAIALLLCKFYDGLDGVWNVPEGGARAVWR